MEFNIGKVKFECKTVVIAEAGVNHLGKMEYAENLIRTAKSAGADIIKFQTYKLQNSRQKMLLDFGTGREKKLKRVLNMIPILL